jgi:hypothetical protein
MSIFTGNSSTALTEKMRVDYLGNVGIGTSSPQSTYKLSISGTDSVFPAVFLENTTNSKSYSMRATGTSWIIRDNSVGADRLTVDTAGNLGLGLAPTDTLSYGRAFDIQGTNGSAAYFRSTTNPTTVYGLFSYDNTEVRTNIAAIGASNYLRFISGGSEKARITSGGELLVGTTSAVPFFGTNEGSVVTPNYIGSSRSGGPALYINRYTSTGTSVDFRYAGTTVGSIDVTGSTTAYNTSSDYRLKNSIAPMTGALAKVALLKPCTYKWNSNGSNGEGFIAHELAEVVPDCVSGAKDAVDADGNPVYQGIDTSFLVATVVAALQELKAEFDAYKASHP